jgi:TRAP-type C4-dicarboxylate transport system permease small subunit
MNRKATAIAFGTLGACLFVVFVLLLLQGCQAGTTGLTRPLSPEVEHTITNTITAAIAVGTQAAPFPWNSLIGGAGAAFLSLLAAWQAFTHSRVAKTAAAVAQLKTESPP